MTSPEFLALPFYELFGTRINVNQILTIVDTNHGTRGEKSDQLYTHFSLLKTLEGAFQLPCLNHACDENVKTMSDLFWIIKEYERPPLTSGWAFL